MNEPQTDEPQADKSEADEPQTMESPDTAPDAESAGTKQQGGDRSRQRYDASTSEATREMRDTSRRRRDAEEKLQQHLKEAKDHVPHQHEPEHEPEPDQPSDRA